MLDRARIAELSDELGSAFGPVIETFMDEIPARIAQMRQHVRDGNRAGLKSLAHSVKGTSAVVGFSGLSAIAAALEAAAASSETSAVADFVEQIGLIFSQSRREFAEARFLT